MQMQALPSERIGNGAVVAGMSDEPEQRASAPEPHALDSPFSLSVFIVTSLGVAPYNWFFVVGQQPLWLVTVLSFAFLYGAALTSIPAGAALKRYVKSKVLTAREAVRLFTAILLLFVIESVGLPAIRVAWEQSKWLSILSGATVIVQLLVTSYLQKIVWDRAVELTDSEAR